MPRIELPEPQHLDTRLSEALETRESAGPGNTAKPIAIHTYATLFGLGLRRRSGSLKRRYPSGGALYPVETYLLSDNLEAGTPAAYHYNPTEHVLEQLWDLPQGFRVKDVAPKPKELNLSALIVFTGVWQRSSAKYGDLAYIHTLLEAGHMSENTLLIASALGINARPYAGFDDARIAQLLDLNEEREQSILTITLCAPHTHDASMHRAR